ncbi:hypothetical protein M5689_012379 [Euphorbia peplus]|nr:hypothetical protein M5689_012379 [Euphorbia peplus]
MRCMTLVVVLSMIDCFLNRPPRVEHLVVFEESRVLDYICKVLDLPPLPYPFWSRTLCPCVPTATSNSNSRGV